MDSTHLKRAIAALLSASALGACATSGAAHSNADASDPRINHEARAAIGREDALTQMTFWAAEYQAFPDDLEAAQRFSEALRKGGQPARAAEVAGDAARRFPDDVTLLGTLGRAELAAGRPQRALRPLALVAANNPDDWAVRSTLGAALDQLGRFDDARAAYEEALALSPDEPAVLTNLGVSYLFAGELEDAEAILTKAVSAPGAPAEARQNLAITLALQGRFEEAERLERVDLPPNLVAQNMAYLRALRADPRRWDDLRGTPQSSDQN